jgi:hypothetical protein
MARGLLLAFAVTLMSTALMSATVVPSIDHSELVDKFLAEGRDLSAVEQLGADAFRKDGSFANEDAAWMWSQYSPRLNGLIDTTAFERADTGKPATREDIAAVTSAEQRDAIATIVQMARNRQIVILNEEHNAPEDRAFGLSVAKALRPLGFGMLAVETFANYPAEMADLAKRGYPVRRTGAYIGDPAFGDFIRQALRLGYKPISYEQLYEQIGPKGSDPVDARELAEATNLAASISRTPQAKFLIYVGYSHAAKTPLHDSKGPKTHVWMAARLKAMTGINPLSIDQTTFGAANVSQSSRFLRNLVQRQRIRRPVTLFTAGRPLLLGQYRDAVDLQVIHPVTRVVHGRPDWLETMGRRPVRPAQSLVPETGRSLVQAFIAAEKDDAVPVDQVVLTAGKTRWFMLPREPVRFVVKEHLPGS